MKKTHQRLTELANSIFGRDLVKEVWLQYHTPERWEVRSERDQSIIIEDSTQIEFSDFIGEINIVFANGKHVFFATTEYGWVGSRQQSE